VDTLQGLNVKGINGQDAKTAIAPRGTRVHRKLEIHYDFVAMILACFALSLGFNLYQRYQYNDLLSQHTALQWAAQDLEINQVIYQRKLETCNKVSPQ
jgi:hypothetical protein